MFNLFDVLVKTVVFGIRSSFHLLILWKINIRERDSYISKLRTTKIIVYSMDPPSVISNDLLGRLQEEWHWNTIDDVAYRQITPAILKKSTHPMEKLKNKILYLLQKYKFVFSLLIDLGKYDGVIIETFFTYKGENLIEELLMELFPKSLLNRTSIEQAFVNLSKDGLYELDIPALQGKLERVSKMTSLSYPLPTLL